MKKNLKKVISAVIALALSVSSVAFAAPEFTDVAETANYAEAVNTLAALDVISGYEDGTFKPDNNITRAEVATLIAAALNRSADAEGAKGTTAFADVNTEAKLWASGYINIGTSVGYISGYEDGTFKPDNNVTFAEIVSMLVRATEYGRYAEYLGGWPNGYLAVGKEKGITEGVSAANNTPVTRAQVAQMIYNAVTKTPVVESTTLTTNANGDLVPSMDIMDGRVRNGVRTPYKTLLTEKHDAYVVEGKVTKTSKTDSTYDAGTVEFTIEYTENFNDSAVVLAKNYTYGAGNAAQEMFVGETDAEDYLLTYAKAIVKVDEYGDNTIVAFVPSGRNETVSYDATLFDVADYDRNNTLFALSTGTDATKNNNDLVNTVATATTAEKATGNYIKFYETKDATKSQRYNLSEKVTLYVNGVKKAGWNGTANTMTRLDFETYVKNNATGVVTLVDVFNANDTAADKGFDYIFVTYYATAKVTNVNATNGRINITGNTESGATIKLDPQDEDLVYNIYYNGEEVEITDIQKDDILSVIFDTNAGFSSSKFYDIYVSRNVVDGKFTGRNDTDSEVTVGGNNYEFVKSATHSSFIAERMGSEFTLNLDYFGRIFDYDTLATSVKYGILDAYTIASSDDYYKATIYAMDGTAKTFEVDTARIPNITTTATLAFDSNDTDTGSDNVPDETLTAGTYPTDTVLKTLTYEWQGPTTKAKRAIQDRVIEYTVSSTTGRITNVTLLAAAASSSASTDEYDIDRNRIGSVVLSDATTIVNAIEYVGKAKPNTTHLDISDLSAFVDETKYTTYAYGTKNADNSYPFVIVTVGASDITSATNFAIVTKWYGQSIDENGDPIYKFDAMYQGGTEPVSLTIAEDGKIDNVTVSSSSTLNRGDIIVFVQDANSEVKKVETVASVANLGLSNHLESEAKTAFTSQSAMFTAIAANIAGSASTGAIANWVVADNNSGWTTANLNDDTKAVIVAGPIVDVLAKSFSIAESMNSSVDTVVSQSALTNSSAVTGVYEVMITDETKVYVWDFNEADNYQLVEEDLGTGAIVASQFDATTFNTATETIDWGSATLSTGCTINYAFAKTVEGEATEVFVILGK